MDRHVLVAVTGDLVPGRGDAPQQGRVLTGGHAKDEERGLGTDLVKQTQQRICLPLERGSGTPAVRHTHPAAYQLVPSVMWGQFARPAGYRKRLKGMVVSAFPMFWEVSA